MPGITIRPLTPERWADFETLMGPKGGCGGCWCMLWRQNKKDHDAGAGENNRLAMKAMVDGDAVPGLLTYDGDVPVGWLSVAPRPHFLRLEGSRVLKPVDDRDVWSVSCLLIAKAYRRKGLAGRMLGAACDFVKERGGAIIEGYPIRPSKPNYPPVYAWTGFEKSFLRAGFERVLLRSPTRPIMRKFL